MGRRFSAASAGPEPEGETLHLPVYVPTLTCSHELWVITDTCGCRTAGLSLRMGREGARARVILWFGHRILPHIHLGGDPRLDRELTVTDH